jgi:hypothetical protein
MTRNQILEHREGILKDLRLAPELACWPREQYVIESARARLALRYVARADVQRFGECAPYLQLLLAKPY